MIPVFEGSTVSMADCRKRRIMANIARIARVIEINAMYLLA